MLPDILTYFPACYPRNLPHPWHRPEEQESATRWEIFFKNGNGMEISLWGWFYEHRFAVLIIIHLCFNWEFISCSSLTPPSPSQSRLPSRFRWGEAIGLNSSWVIYPQNIARGTTDPGIVSITCVISPPTKHGKENSSEGLHWFQFWQPGGGNCIR